MLQQLLLAASPFVVSFVAGLLKRIPSVEMSGYRKEVMRVLVALMSFGAVIGASAISGAEIDVTSVEVVVQVVFNFLGATGVYLLAKNR